MTNLNLSETIVRAKEYVTDKREKRIKGKIKGIPLSKLLPVVIAIESLIILLEVLAFLGILG